jgi:hypothetical protein
MSAITITLTLTITITITTPSNLLEGEEIGRGL